MSSTTRAVSVGTTVLSLSVLATALTGSLDNWQAMLPDNIVALLQRIRRQEPPQPPSRFTWDFAQASWRTNLIGLLLIVVLVKALPVLRAAIGPDPHAEIPTETRISFLTGNMGLRDTDDYDGQNLVKSAQKLRSPVFFLPAPMGSRLLVVGDNVAINHILHDVNFFPSTEFRLEFIKFVVGGGLVVATGKDHAKQRRVMGPAFTQAHIRTLTPIFTSKADELGEKIVAQVRQGGNPKWPEEGADGGAVVDMSELMDSASFDIIGKAGFGIDFDCIKKGAQNVELAKGYNAMLQATVTFDLPRLVLLLVSGITRSSWLGLPLNKPNIVIHRQNAAIDRMAEYVLDRTLKRAEQWKKDGGEAIADSTDGAPLNLLAMICRSNAQMQSKGQASAMTRDEMRGMVRTLLFAGYETSSVTTSMTLHYLAHNQRVLGRVQTHLLSYLRKRKEDNGGVELPLTADELQSSDMALLTNCIRETLRLSPAVTMTEREATQDCVIPLSRPIATRDGKGTLTQLHIRKGTHMGMCLKLPNVDEQYWGPEPLEWNPDRWTQLPESYKSASMPGPAGMTTFSNGPASCIGSRFAMLEMAALLVAILRRVRVEPSAKYKIKPKPVIVVRPVEQTKGVVALPLRVIPLEQPQ